MTIEPRLGVALLILVACVEPRTYTTAPRFAFVEPTELFELRQGGEPILFRVSVERERGETTAIDLSAEGLPLGFVAEPGEIAAGEAEGWLRVRLLEGGGHPGVTYPITIVGRSGGAVAETTVKVFVVGRSGTLDRVLAPLDRTTYQALSRAPALRGGLLFTGEKLWLVDADGQRDQAFGDGGSVTFRATAFGPRSPREALPRHLLYQRDGKLLVAMDYRHNGETGLLVFRVLPDGTIDAAFGPERNATALVIPHEDFTPKFLVPLENDEALLVAEHQFGGAPARAMRISRDGDLLDDGLFDVAGGLGSVRPELLVEPNAKLAVTTAPGIIRFDEHLTRDLAFGEGGILALGDTPPLLMRLSGGYLAAGSVDGYAAMWSFDEQWQPRSGRNGAISPPLAGVVASVVEDRGKLVAVVSSDRIAVVRYDRDLQLDPSFGVGGVLDVSSIGARDTIIGIIRSTHSRAFVLWASGARYHVARIWL